MACYPKLVETKGASLDATAHSFPEGACLEHTHSSQYRLHSHGMAISPRCKLCGAELGTLWHRHYECPCWSDKRRQRVDQFVLRCAQVTRSQGLKAGERFTCGIFPDPSYLIARREVPDTDRVTWYRKPSTGTITGNISDLVSRLPNLRKPRNLKYLSQT